MAGHGVCPWWAGYLLASPVRRLLHDPGRLLKPYVKPGMTVLEPGPGMGFFTLELARRVGPSGRVIAVDVQARMIAALRRRAHRAGLDQRIDARVVPPDSMMLRDLHDAVDFVLAFAVVHELPSVPVFFTEVAQAMRQGATLLLAEPAGHVRAADFAAELEAADQAGLSLAGHPILRRSLAALLQKDR